MVITDTMKSVQFLVNPAGQQTGVVLNMDDWERLVDWIENAIDIKIATQALRSLNQAGGRPEHAGWLAWDDIEEEWDG